MLRQLLLLAILTGLALAAPSDKVDGSLKSILGSQGQANVVVTFTQATDTVLSRMATMRFDSRGAKITTMKSQLEELQSESQKNAIHILSGRFSDINFHSLWINNRIYIENATPELVSALASLPEVAEVREEYVAWIEEPTPSGNSTIQAEWGINKIEADQAWALPGGNNGKGVVVSIIDTGVRHTHEILRNNYKPSYGWFDPYDKNEEPVDEHGHGTHVMGTLAGSQGYGVAPGAQWIACRGCNNNACFESGLARCGQWILCPTLPDGESSPDCSEAPSICSNSWSTFRGANWFNSIIDSWHAAGIIPVFIQGNRGPSCASGEAPGDNPDVLSVGSTDISDVIAPTSGRGPTLVGGNLKPDISAPGLEILSSHHISDTAYRVMTGTSMAAPHVSGTIALLLSQNPNLSYNQVKNLLQDNTDRNLGEADTCGDTPPTLWPNNIYGYGRINARKSLAAAINPHKKIES